MATSVAAVTALHPSLPGFCPVTDAVASMAGAGIDERGAIFTRREVVNFILDLVGYTLDQPLYERRLLEPSFGHGDFLLPAIDRLLATWRAAGAPNPLASLADSIRAVELHRASAEHTRDQVLDRLQGEGVGRQESEVLADHWLACGDFLLTPLDGQFDYVVGNPPYIRQELIPDVLMAEYRARYSTIYDRADIYVPFIERSAHALAKGGHMGFICSDRWMKNRYGARLRQLISDRFHLKTYVDMVDTPAFHAEVVAYPAITVISREKSGPTRIAVRPNIDGAELAVLSAALTGRAEPDPESGAREIHRVTDGANPWVLESTDQLALVRRLEASFPTIEETGCKVGIGVATGADKAFTGLFDALDVEPCRKLRMATTRDIDTGIVLWRGQGVINPFGADGRLVDLAKFPRLARYLEDRKDKIAKRHVAQKAPANWYRTIDRIYPELANRPKLLIPDIKGEANIVYEEGRLYPHHNLYFITSDHWDIQALQAVLLSGIARLFVATYSTKMRGGYLRFQAQYLRRIRLPRWRDVSGSLQRRLIAAATAKNIEACNEAVFELYQLSESERAALGGKLVDAA
ncbi:Eco57I restriction-modification methylase domain-containing protein [Bosea sp. (in: a-proteobacteria)]|jgi:Eco57I restriction-modification methylase/TaqI-like C-terminal specificity domain|uniref:Eco57I restriction-modification methylase domain-containing protein n=1 Tax=Bosea sp. (in: a-proteobacteria) TaxID=1871050 RepID=UPI0025C72A3C|nr:Eco57I restriction-modification methylase domain-containing protein [Bosea sp. (in: a-proteobacteria)]